MQITLKSRRFAWAAPVLAVVLTVAAIALTFPGAKPQPRGAAQPPLGAEDPAVPVAADHRHTNRLIHEKSPYLLMHARNPVDWYPWGEEAFEKARRENKPIFLSVGYYTCHWCHVMERESFSNPEVAALINRWFVSIKVDREERPDIDGVYMTFVEATTGSGGWPMTVFLTPDRKPFFGGTYFPPADEYRRPGLKSVLPKIAEQWSKQHDRILRSADQITDQLRNFVNSGVGTGGQPQTAVLDKAYEQIAKTYDPQNGGFGQAPKFPRPVTPEFLLRYWARTHKKEALDMTLNTLRAMAAGGVHDQLGGGFHRYSTDAHWRVPHFEKMLYDEAQLAELYTEAFQITHDPLYANVAHDILDFVLREMRDTTGGFYSALDADSLVSKGKPAKGEGAFYVWTAAEIEQTLGPEAAAIFNFRYSVKPEGNVPPQQDIEGWLKGKNVLYEEHSLANTAKKFNKSEADAQRTLDQARQKLFTARALRPRPPTDTKVITAWNGLMISALARASQVLNEPRYLEAASKDASFVEAQLYDFKTGKLKRRYREGSVQIDGYLDDYAFLIQGLLDLYEASFDIRLVSWAIKLEETQDQLFWDAQQGGYFTTTGKDSSILLRSREAYDSAEPSPNSVGALNLLRLWQITDRQKFKDYADKTLAAFSSQLDKAPESMPYMAAALDFSVARHQQIVIAGALGADDTRTLLRLVWQRYIPNKILMLADGGQGQRQLARWLPLLANVTRKQGRATAYICENYVCSLPTPDPHVVSRLLDGNR
jgi:uncharacterized protein YyaL (SSP411 family)